MRFNLSVLLKRYLCGFLLSRCRLWTGLLPGTWTWLTPPSNVWPFKLTSGRTDVVGAIGHKLSLLCAYISSCHVSRQPFQNHSSEHLEGEGVAIQWSAEKMLNGQQSKSAMPKLLTMASGRKDWKTISAESSIMSHPHPPPMTPSRNWTELNLGNPTAPGCHMMQIIIQRHPWRLRPAFGNLMEFYIGCIRVLVTWSTAVRTTLSKWLDPKLEVFQTKTWQNRPVDGWRRACGLSRRSEPRRHR